MITLITGVPGAGKSLRAMYYLQKFLSEGRPIYTNIDGTTLPEIPDDDWTQTPEGSVVCIDEAQRFWPQVKPGTPAPDQVRAMETHRHSGHDLIIVTQHPSLISHHIRRLVGRHEHIQRTGGWNRVAVISADRTIDLSDKNDRRNCEKQVWKYPKEIFKLYKSATMHTVKKRMPQPIKIGLIVVPVFLVAIVWGLSNSFIGKMIFGDVVEASAEPAPAPAPAPSPAINPYYDPPLKSTDKKTPQLEAEPIHIVGLAVWGSGGTVIYEQGNVSWRVPISQSDCFMSNNRWQCRHEGRTYRF